MSSYDNWLEAPYYTGCNYCHEGEGSRYGGFITFRCDRCGEIKIEVGDPDAPDWDEYEVFCFQEDFGNSVAVLVK